jgi:hypothetical protein
VPPPESVRISTRRRRRPGSLATARPRRAGWTFLGPSRTASGSPDPSEPWSAKDGQGMKAVGSSTWAGPGLSPSTRPRSSRRDPPCPGCRQRQVRVSRLASRPGPARGPRRPDRLQHPAVISRPRSGAATRARATGGPMVVARTVWRS